jgi:hypothetical protein
MGQITPIHKTFKALQAQLRDVIEVSLEERL